MKKYVFMLCIHFGIDDITKHIVTLWRILLSQFSYPH